MVKVKISKKIFTYESILAINGNEISALLSYEFPIYYSVNKDKSTCDYYLIDNTYLCVGSNPLGIPTDRALNKVYNQKAIDILSKTEKLYSPKNSLRKLIKEWMDEEFKSVVCVTKK